MNKAGILGIVVLAAALLIAADTPGVSREEFDALAARVEALEKQIRLNEGEILLLKRAREREFKAAKAETPPIPETAGTITCQAIRIVDEKGTYRGSFGLINGIPGLVLYGASGGSAAILVTASGPSLDLRAPEGNGGLTLMADRTGPTVGLIDGRDKTRAWFRLLSAEPRLDYFDGTGARIRSFTPSGVSERAAGRPAEGAPAIIQRF